MAPIIGEPDPVSIVSGGDVVPYIWIGAPKQSDGSGAGGQIGKAWLIGGPGSGLRQAKEDFAETDIWSTSYVAARDLGLIFCPPEITRSMYLAAEAIMRIDYGIRVPESMLAFAKQDAPQLDRARRRLSDSGWYDDKPNDLRAEPQVLLRADANSRIQNLITANLGGYQGPLVMPDGASRGTESHLTELKVRNWIKQFPTETLAESALSLLESVRHIDRVYINSVLDSFLEDTPEIINASLVPLGQPKDSSSVLTYCARDVAERRDLTVRTIDDAVLRDEPIVMIDDYIGRGSASITALETWLDESDTQGLDQERVSPLPPQLRSRLKGAECHIIFANGKEAGKQNLEGRARELGFENLSVTIYDTDTPTISGLRNLPARDQEELIEFCRKIGEAAFLADGKADSLAADRALGYGNEGLLLISSYNTPTATLAALWKSSTTWNALFPRLAKP